MGCASSGLGTRPHAWRERPPQGKRFAEAAARPARLATTAARLARLALLETHHSNLRVRAMCGMWICPGPRGLCVEIAVCGGRKGEVTSGGR